MRNKALQRKKIGGPDGSSVYTIRVPTKTKEILTTEVDTDEVREALQRVADGHVPVEGI